MDGAKHALNICNVTHAAACAVSKRQLSITSSLTKAISACSGTEPIGSLYAHHAIHHASNQSSGALGQAIRDAHKAYSTHGAALRAAMEHQTMFDQALKSQHEYASARLVEEALHPSGGSSELVEEALGPVGVISAKKH